MDHPGLLQLLLEGAGGLLRRADRERETRKASLRVPGCIDSGACHLHLLLYRGMAVVRQQLRYLDPLPRIVWRIVKNIANAASTALGCRQFID